jgi:hypothetical protein
MISVLSLALENRERKGDGNQKAEAQNLKEKSKHAQPLFKKYQIYSSIVKD